MERLNMIGRPELTAGGADDVEIGNGVVRLCFSRRHPLPSLAPSPTHHLPVDLPRNRPPPMQMTASVRAGDSWRPLFDAPSPVISGDQFNWYADKCEILIQTRECVAVRLSGRHLIEGYDWQVCIECREDSPLIHIVAKCDLSHPLTLSEPQPSAMLWSDSWSPEVELNQGPGNIYTGHAENGWGNAFPAAYGWGHGIEVGFFAQMSQLTWMTASRFNKAYRVQLAKQGGRTGIGLFAHQITRNPIPAGERVIAEYYLYASPRADRPTRLAALDRLVDVFAECHPPAAEPPTNRLGEPTTWRHFSRGIIRNLLVKDEGGNAGACWDRVPVTPTWNDGSTPAVDRLRVCPDYALQSGSWPATNRKRAIDLWDFSTCFNCVAPWIGIERLNPDARWREALSQSTAGMPLFYQPDLQMILRFPRRPPVDMSWQVLTFYIEMLKAHDLAAPEHFNPAIGGSVLLGLPGLIQLAHNENYIWPQFFLPQQKKGIANQDIKSLGLVREPWQNGSYAWIMARAYQMTGEPTYLAEAERSLDELLGGRMRYSVTNLHYDIRYDDPTEFPITEIFGNGYGIAAGQLLHQLTGQPRFRQSARDFFNSLARLAFWYESALECDPRDQILQNLGLFQAFHSYAGAAPWETIEAFLPMTIMLRADNPLAPVGLMMRLFNTMRANAFWFYPPVFHGETITSPQLQASSADYLSIENFYMPERGGDHGGMGRCIYMTQLALWNELLFETFAHMDDPRIMVLSLDILEGFHEAVEGVERNFYVFNPLNEHRTVVIRFDYCRPGSHDVAIRVNNGREQHQSKHSADHLEQGIQLTLPALSFARIRVRHEQEPHLREQLNRMRIAQNKLCHAYQRWRGSFSVDDDRKTRSRDHFLKAMERYHAADYPGAADHAAQSLAEIINRDSSESK